MAKPNSLAKTSRHVHLKLTINKKDIKLPHEKGICGREVTSEILESDDRFIVKVTRKSPLEKDLVDERTYPKNSFKWKKETW